MVRGEYMIEQAFDRIRDEYGITLMEEKNKQLISVLNGLSDKKIPNEETTLDDIAFFCLSLVYEQRLGVVPEMKGAWCFQQNPFEIMMPRDARIDFIHKPTYLAVSILSYVDAEYPVVSNQIDGYHEALRNGMAFSARTELVGHTYEEADGLVEFLGYFVKGKVISTLVKDPYVCQELYAMLLNLKRTIGRAVSEKRVYDLFGNNREKQLKTINEQLFML